MNPRHSGVEFLQTPTHHEEKFGALRGQRYLARCAIEQAEAELGFQFANQKTQP